MIASKNTQDGIASMNQSLARADALLGLGANATPADITAAHEAVTTARTVLSIFGGDMHHRHRPLAELIAELHAGGCIINGVSCAVKRVETAKERGEPDLITLEVFFLP